jgi:peptidyl-prolyl cis-trans isomerase SurA
MRNALFAALLLLLPAALPPAAAQESRIVAVVNGDAITSGDIRNRSRLFALNVGRPVDAETLRRLAPQVTRLLIEERLRFQEVQRRGVPVTDQDVADAVAEIEARNNLPRGGLVAQLRRAGVEPRALYDQLRTQIGWSRLVRATLGPAAEPTQAEAEAFVRNYMALAGQPEFLVSEIFIPVDDPANEAEARRFVDDVVNQLRRGIPFPVAAAQFSQAQSALQGGDLGWVRAEELDPQVAEIVRQMPPGAIANPIRVPGGYQLVQLRQRRTIGREDAAFVTIRQAFLPFTSRLDPQRPTPQQIQTLERAQAIRGGCPGVEAAARAANSPRPADPGGPLRLDQLPPQLRQVLAAIPTGGQSQPLVTPEGILVFAVCARETRNVAEMTPQQAAALILRDRVELVSRQLQRDLRRRAQIEMRG